MAFKPSVLLSVLLLAGCAAGTAIDGPATGAGTSLPTGARLSAGGYLTILEAPPSPLPDEPPPEPQFIDDFPRLSGSPDPAIRAKAWEEKNGSAAFQEELRRLQEVLRREQPDNFIQARLVRDPNVAAEIWLRRDAARTLARYTSNPLFRPREGGITSAELRRRQALWEGRARGGDIISIFGINTLTGEVELTAAVEEAEFRRAAAERGWELGPEVKLDFPRPRPPAFADPSLARYVRTFARETRAKGIQVAAGSKGHIVLQDGCFRLVDRRSGRPGPLVLFGRETQLGLDRQGYLTVMSGRGGHVEDERRYRVGELGSWGGSNSIYEGEPEVRELRRRCGDGEVVNVAEPESERLFSVPYSHWVADYARAKSLTYREAWREVIGCMEREIRRGRRDMEARGLCIKQFN